jgi:hypothetical protein
MTITRDVIESALLATKVFSLKRSQFIGQMTRGDHRGNGNVSHRFRYHFGMKVSDQFLDTEFHGNLIVVQKTFPKQLNR